MAENEHRTYDIKHRKTRLQSMVYEEQAEWIERNHNKKDFKSESGFVTHLLSLGIIEYRKQKLSEVENG